MENLVIQTDFWRGRRVLITGHTGFKGSWLSLWLQHMGAEVSGYALAPPTCPSLFEVADIATGMTSVVGDVRDLEPLKQLLTQQRPEVVFHMAAQPLVRRSYDDPVATYSTNVMGTVHTLEAARQTGGVRAFVNVTSDKCYQNQEWLWGYREGEAMGGYDPYSNSKGCSELVTASYRDSFFNPNEYERHGLGLASARAGNVIGGGDWATDRLVPDMISTWSRGGTVSIRNPDAIRPWQHVLEPLSGYLLLAERLWQDGPQYAESWNFGPVQEDEVPVSHIVSALAERWPGDAPWQIDQDDHPHEAHYLKLDCSKARARMCWRPRWSLDRCMDMLADWYRAHLDGADMRTVTMSQIKQYVAHTNTAAEVRQ